MIKNLFAKIKLKYLSLKQDSLIFKPKQKDIALISAPSSYGLYKIKEYYLKVNDNENIQIWLFNSDSGNKGKEAPFVIAFHGNTGHWGNVGYPEDGEVFDPQYRIGFLQSLQDKNISFCAVSLRGYGKSDGVPSEDTFIEDIKAVTKYLIEEKNINNNQITVFGESLGASSAFICAEYLSKIGKTPRLLATVAAFTSMNDKVLNLHPDLKNSNLKDVIRHPFDSLKAIDNINSSVKFCIMHPEKDQTTDITHAYKIHEKAIKSGKESEVLILKNAGHITWNTNDVVNNIIKYYK